MPEDNTPPTLTVNHPVSGGTYAGGFTATYSATDDVADVLRVAFDMRDGARPCLPNRGTGWFDPFEWGAWPVPGHSN